MACRKELGMNTNDISETRKLVPFTETQRDAATSSRSSTHAAWRTPYGRVEGSFWAIPDHSISDDRDGTRFPSKLAAARLALVPSGVGRTHFRVVFDFTPSLDPCATITYQAMIPSDSKVFRIAQSGDVGELLELLNGGTASLTDRDEEGRSLLNVRFVPHCLTKLIQEIVCYFQLECGCLQVLGG